MTDKRKLNNELGNGCSGLSFLMFLYFSTVFFVTMSADPARVWITAAVLASLSLISSVIFMAGVEVDPSDCVDEETEETEETEESTED